jgi:hypothetical protein
MTDDKTPKPGDSDYPVNHPQDLNKPKFNSTGMKEGDEQPPVENMNDQQKDTDTDNAVDVDVPETDLANPRDDDEDDQERIIRR